MRIEQFIYLKKIAQTKSINLASKNLFITQQALSNAIIKLEEELGVPLLLRTKTGVSLTSAGEYVLQEGEKLIAISDNIRNHFLTQQHSDTTCLNISSTPVAQRFLLSVPTSYFYKNLPNVTIHIAQKTSDEIVEDVLTEKSHIGFLSEIEIENQSDFTLPASLKYVPVFSSTMNILCSKHSVLNQYKKIPLSVLKEQTFILLDNINSEEDVIYKLFSDDGLPKILTVDNETLFTQMIRDDLGCAFFNPIYNFSETSTYNDPTVTLRPIEKSINVSFGYILKEKLYQENIFMQIFCMNL